MDLEEWAKLATQEVTEEQLCQIIHPNGDESPLKKFRYDLTKDDYEFNSLFFPIKLPTIVKNEEMIQESTKENLNFEVKEKVKQLEIIKEKVVKDKQEEKSKIEELKKQGAKESRNRLNLAVESIIEVQKEEKLISEVVKQEFKCLKQEDLNFKQDKGDAIEIPTLYNQDWKLNSNLSRIRESRSK